MFITDIYEAIYRCVYKAGRLDLDREQLDFKLKRHPPEVLLGHL